MSEFQTVCKLHALKEGEGKTVAVGQRLVAIFLIDGQPSAIDDCCPHMGASLAGGSVENTIVTCPWHGWRFRVTDGTWADNPRVKTGCHVVRIVGDDVQIQIAEKPQ
jgi:nitrite reductase (NADH) small subunit/3-phenylpropionate/trans-cinnamate dioxygenase ferredoxin subunit